jgi:hypothetical protein
MERRDEPGITGDVVLWRRIPNRADRVSLDGQGGLCPSSSNFKHQDDELSIHLADLTSEELVLSGHDGFGLAAIKAGDVRRILGAGAVICTDPQDAADPAHKIICFKVSGSQAKRLAKAATWVRRPTLPGPDEAGQTQPGHG